MNDKKNYHDPCYFRDIEAEFIGKIEKMIDNRVQIANSDQDQQMQKLIAERFEEFKQELISYFSDKFRPDLTDKIMEMNKTLLENAYQIKIHTLTSEEKAKQVKEETRQKKMELWKIILAGIFGALGIAIVQLISEVVKKGG